MKHKFTKSGLIWHDADGELIDDGDIDYLLHELPDGTVLTVTSPDDEDEDEDEDEEESA